MNRVVLNVSAISILAAFTLVAPAAAANRICGGGKIIDLAVNIPTNNPVNGVSRSPNLAILLDYSLAPQNENVQYGTWLGKTGWITFSFMSNSPAVWQDLMLTTHTAFLAGTNVYVFNTLQNDCRSFDTNSTVVSCPTGSTQPCIIGNVSSD